MSKNEENGSAERSKYRSFSPSQLQRQHVRRNKSTILGKSASENLYNAKKSRKNMNSNWITSKLKHEAKNLNQEGGPADKSPKSSQISEEKRLKMQNGSIFNSTL